MQQLLAHRNILVLFADALIVLYRRWNHLLIFNVHLLFCRYYHLILSGSPSQCNVSLSFTNIIILFLSVIIATTGSLQRLVLLLPISSFNFIGCSHYLCSLQHIGSFCQCLHFLLTDVTTIDPFSMYMPFSCRYHLFNFIEYSYYLLILQQMVLSCRYFHFILSVAATMCSVHCNT